MALGTTPPEDEPGGLWLEAVWGAVLCGSILLFAGLVAIFLH